MSRFFTLFLFVANSVSAMDYNPDELIFTNNINNIFVKENIPVKMGVIDTGK